MLDNGIQQRQQDFEKICKKIKANFWPQAPKDYFNKIRGTEWRKIYSLSFENKIPYPADTVWNVIRQAKYFPRWFFHKYQNYQEHSSECFMDEFAAGSGFILFENCENFSDKSKYPEFIASKAIVDYREDNFVVIPLYENTYLKLSVHSYERYTTKIKAEITKYGPPPLGGALTSWLLSSLVKKENEQERINDNGKFEDRFKWMVKEITAICYDLDHPQINMSDCYWFTTWDDTKGTIHFYPNKDGRKVPYVGHYITAKERICYVQPPSGTRMYKDTYHYERGESFIVDKEYSKEKYSLKSEKSGYIANILKQDGDCVSTYNERIFLVCKTLDALKRVTGDVNIEHDKI